MTDTQKAAMAYVLSHAVTPAYDRNFSLDADHIASDDLPYGSISPEPEEVK